MTDTQIIILAAGHGKRMNNGDLPKVLVPIQGKPMIQYVLDEIKQAGIDTNPIIVIGQKADKVKATLGPSYRYILQKEQLGTGHAVACARDICIGKADKILVLYGDMPLISAHTIQQLAQGPINKNATLSMATIILPNFDSWYKSFIDFGRIIRDDKGNIIRIVEKKDATPEEAASMEVNPNYLCFKNAWLWKNIDKLKNNNAQGEYYLTDLIKMACDQQETITSIQIEPREGIGVNSAEQLRFAEQLL